jgi:hypothetical protein
MTRSHTRSTAAAIAHATTSSSRLGTKYPIRPSAICAPNATAIVAGKPRQWLKWRTRERLCTKVHSDAVIMPVVVALTRATRMPARNSRRTLSADTTAEP